MTEERENFLIQENHESVESDLMLNNNNNSLQPVSPREEAEHDSVPENELLEVKSNKVWNWIKSHKKQILIAAGITAITVAAVVSMTQLAPALAAASKANQILQLTGQMSINSKAWFGASTVGQQILHGGNAVLAQALSSVTGLPNVFVSSGAWTFGGQTVGALASSATASLASSLQQVAAITKATSVIRATGIGTFVAGAAIPKEKTKEYKSLIREMNALKSESPSLTEEEITNKAEAITNRIVRSQTLPESERTILLRKISKTLKKSRANAVQHDIQINEEMENTELPLESTPSMSM